MSSESLRARLDARTPLSWPNYPPELPRKWEVRQYIGGAEPAEVFLSTPLGVIVNDCPSSQIIATYCVWPDAELIARAPEDLEALLRIVDAARAYRTATKAHEARGYRFTGDDELDQALCEALEAFEALP